MSTEGTAGLVAGSPRVAPHSRGSHVRCLAVPPPTTLAKVEVSAEADRPRPTVAVVGAGAIGTFFAAHLTAAGTADVSVCVRTPVDRLVVESEIAPVEAAPRVLSSSAEVERPADWVLFTVKAHQTEGARGWLDALVDAHTRVVVLQNGIEHESRIRPLVPTATPILPAVIYCGAEAVSPGHIVHRNHGFLIVGDGPDGTELAELYAGSGAHVRCSADLRTDLWLKLTANVVANGITALTGRRFEVFTHPPIAALAERLARECIEVACADGAAIDSSYAEILVAGVQGVDPTGGTSMLYDTIAGRPLEHDALHGAVVRAADRHGVEVPTVELVFALLDARSLSPR